MIETLEISATRLSDVVAERIADAIMDGTIPAGSRVRDHELAQQLGVSRMPVREALQRLQRVGLIETAASRYTRVTEVTPELADSTRRFSGHYMVSLVRMAIARIEPNERTKAARSIDDLAYRLEETGDLVAARRDILILLIALASNSFISAMSSDIGIAIQRNLIGTRLPLDTAPELAASFRELRDAFLDGDADRAERIARAQYGIDDE
ncbi:GntR family transcriptional regulator [Microbacterium stercoris]|uniref:GntR family transcriptional regulator n=1 Tax=Microbacterium stercoris TaxID=2820289 RepID=A0A939QK35_9MICO|nr:GntR family transcriptional regulator [Microbacterium stercoris]MBO3662380.1 GntR family transcriptional regulator [Microbacterium stercoris]MBO3664372.1 GntR family transcriptional regulator [Microbacterium stercoris]